MLDVGTKVFPFRNPQNVGVITATGEADTVTVDWNGETTTERVSALGEVIRPFRDIVVEPLEAEFDQYYRARVDWCNWCGRAATHRVTRTSNLSDNTYIDYACEIHAAEWATAANDD